MIDKLDSFLQDLTADLYGRLSRDEPQECWHCKAPPPLVRRYGRDICLACDSGERREYRQKAAEERERNFPTREYDE